jgi:O-antigen ligase
VSANPAGAKRSWPLTFDGKGATVFGRPIGRDDVLSAIVTVVGAAALALVWTLVAYRVGPMIALALLLVIAVLALIAMRPMAGVYLGVLCVPLEQLDFASAAADVTPAKGLLFYTGLVAACHFLLGARRARPHPGHIAFGLLLLVGVLGLAVTDDSLTTAKILAQWASYLWLSMYVATADRTQLGRLLGCIVLAGAVVGATAVLTSGDQQLVAGGQAVTGRAQAAFDHPATLAFFLVLAFPLALVLGFRSRASARVPAFAAAGLCLGGIMLSLTRGAILGAVFAMLVMLLWADFRRLAAVLLVAILAFSAFNLKAIERSQEVRVIGARLQTITDTRATADNERTKIWAKTPQLIADHPFFGVGAGNFSTVSARYNILDAFGAPFVHAHDVMLTIAAEFGLLGLALFTFFIGSLLREAIRVIGRARASPSYPLALALAAALAGLFVNGITDYPPATLVIMGTLMVEIGAFIGYTRVVEDERVQRDDAVS